MRVRGGGGGGVGWVGGGGGGGGGGAVVGLVGCYSSPNSLMDRLSCKHDKAMHNVSALRRKGCLFLT